MESLEDILTCCVCLDKIVAPKILPCQHTFCKEPCLSSIIRDKCVMCPMCRKTFIEPVNGFPTNIVMEKCVADGIKVNDTVEETRCEICLFSGC